MPSITLINDTDTRSLSSTTTSTSTSSLRLYNDSNPQFVLKRRKSTVVVNRLSRWVSRRISRQGLNSSLRENEYAHEHGHDHGPQYRYRYRDTDGDEDEETDTTRIFTERDRRRWRREMEEETERELQTSYAAFCNAFTAAGEAQLHHQQQQQQQQQQRKRETGMGADEKGQSGIAAETEREVEMQTRAPVSTPSKAVTLDSQPIDPLSLQPPPQILTPSLYAEMRRTAHEEKTPKQRRLWGPFHSLFLPMRQRESS